MPRDRADQLEALLRALDDELKRPTGRESSQLRGHLISVVLLWLERWYDASQEERPDPDEAQVKLLRGFVRVLERDYAAHHDAGHYADELRLPPATLSRALTQVTGRGTKELVLDRVMSEAARLLRFTDQNVQQVALRWATTIPSTSRAPSSATSVIRPWRTGHTPGGGPRHDHDFDSAPCPRRCGWGPSI